MNHELKIWPDFFQPLVLRKKTFEIRWDDRGYAIGDQLHLREWNPKTRQYTGRETYRRVTWIGKSFGLLPGHVCLALEVINE